MKKNKQQFIPVPCRAIVVVESRNKGVPISRALMSTDSTLPSEEAIMGFGIFGIKVSGQPFARAGIYNFKAGLPVFKFAVNFNTQDGSAMVQAERHERHSLSESEMALLNWIQGGLFNEKIQDGSYHLKVDNINHPHDVDVDEARDLEHKIRRFPERKTFAAERRLESALQMFEDNLEREVAVTLNPVCPQAPTAINLLGSTQIPKHFFDAEQKPLIPLVLEFVRPSAFMSFAISRFCNGLRSQVGLYREIKSGFIKAFNLIDTYRHRGATTMMHAMVDRTIASLKVSSLQHVKSLEPKRVEGYEEEIAAALQSGLEALRIYSECRDSEGNVLLYRAGDTDDEVMAQKLRTLFSAPLFTAVKSEPVQIVSEFRSNGEFPYDGLDLFRTVR